jgi:lipopolysaccharide transport system ATP-binding protein
MSKAIFVENLSKLYRLGEVGTGTLSHDLNRFWAKIRGKEDPFAKLGQVNDRTQKAESDYVWALKDINFEVEEGDILGIIGRNGAGKSTLLKLLSRVTSPTIGSIKVKGRIASLLEVGTGFHPEMTGRENIYMNGAILGMRKKEIDRKLEEIVDFSGVEKYLDTPVKRYSSGMYVRLAFAVAAHLESEILIVDEVLAVGDAEFQKKCLGKMGDISKGEGRTVLFVSHNIRALKDLCKSAIILKNGKLESNGSINDTINNYLNLDKNNIFTYTNSITSSHDIWFRSITVKNSRNELENNFNYNEEINIEFQLGNNIVLSKHKYTIFIMVLDELKNRIFAAESEIIKQNEIVLKISPKTLVRGKYSIHAFIHIPCVKQIDVAEDVCMFSVSDKDSFLSKHNSYDYGKIFANVTWIQ